MNLKIPPFLKGPQLNRVYISMIGCISLVYIILLVILSLIFLVWVFSFPPLVNFAKSLLILFIFYDNWVFLLIVYIFIFISISFISTLRVIISSHIYSFEDWFVLVKVLKVYHWLVSLSSFKFIGTDTQWCKLSP